MKYSYVPGSTAAHERAAVVTCCARHAGREAPAPAYRVLTWAKAVEFEHPAVPADARKLANGLLGIGALHVEARRAIAEECATMQLVDSVSVRWVRLGVRGYAVWHNGRTAGGQLQGVGPLTLSALRVALGLDEPPSPPRLCDHWLPYLEPCGRVARVRQDGQLYGHKRMDGLLCV